MIPSPPEKSLLRFSTMGSVDDGKSTLIGRLLYDSGNILQDHLDSLRRDSKDFAHGDIDFSLLTDGLQAEREQGITIDVAYRYFSTPHRDFIVADTPGHTQYTRNMATGASLSDLAIILIDATKGVTEQTKRHSYIAALMRIPHFVIAVNKMDLLDYSEIEFQKIRAAYLEFTPSRPGVRIDFVPVSALTGDNLVHPSKRMSWYTGPTVMHHLLETQPLPATARSDFRFTVQTVLRNEKNARHYAGRLTSGTLHEGDEAIVLPSFKKTRIHAIHTPAGKKSQALVGQSVSLVLEHELDISRGDAIVSAQNPPVCADSFAATCIWMSEDELDLQKSYWIQHGHRRTKAQVEKLHHRLNIATLQPEEALSIALNDIAEVSLLAHQPLFFDAYERLRASGGFLLIDPATHRTVAAGLFKAGESLAARSRSRHPSAANLAVTGESGFRADKEKLLRQRAVTLWLTGLSSSGKSTLSQAVEKRLLEVGRLAICLDGDQVRSTLNQDLGFSPHDRKENIRRVAATAKMLNDNGLIAIVALISPFSADRELAKQSIGPDRFFEVYIDAPLDVCEARDPKNLYKKARSGSLAGFTGIGAPYERPTAADLVIQTDRESLEASTQKLFDFILKTQNP